jgi:hypothetical protein
MRLGIISLPSQAEKFCADPYARFTPFFTPLLTAAGETFGNSDVVSLEELNGILRERLCG